MPRLSDSKQKIKSTTQEMLQKGSYKSITFEKIAHELNINKASLYHHFKTKDDLILAVLKKYHTDISKSMTDMELQNKNPEQKMRAYFKFFFDINQTIVGMCLGGVLCVEYDVIKDIRVKKELKSFFNYIFKWLTNVLHEGQIQGVFNFEGTPEDKAMMIESTIQGGLLLARMLQENSESLDQNRYNNFFLNILKQLKNDLRIKSDKKWYLTSLDYMGEPIFI